VEILVVEDEPQVAKQLKETLQQETYKTTTVSSVAEAKHVMSERNFDLVLLDWNLPDGDGIALMHTWRQQKIAVPVLVLSANVTVDDRVHALNVGADDYLCKPYSSIELLARIRALLRRDAPIKSSKISAEDVVLDIIAREVTVGGRPVRLSTAEFDLLTLLMQHQNIVLTRYQLNEHISKDFDRISVSNLIDVHIRNIRKKLERPDLIQSVRGVGYTIKAS
jgi:DNA-binding response OmpR family regulator